MFLSKNKEQNLEQETNKNEKLLQQLLIRVDALDREVKGLLDELKVSPSQVSSYLENRDNFTSENWEALQVERKSVEDKLKRDVENIRNPSKVKQTQADRRVEQHWLFVR